MSHSPALQSLLFSIRQHAAFPELLKAVEAPQLKTFKPSSGDDLQQAGAKFAHYSGRKDQHDNWRSFLTGEAVPAGDEEKA